MRTIILRKNTFLDWLRANGPQERPVMFRNGNADVPREAIAELRRAYKADSILLTRTVKQFGKHSELIDGRFHERPIIAESIVGMGVVILAPSTQRLALKRGIGSMAKLFNAARNVGVKFLTHEWVPLQKRA